ncbi:MAG: cation-translocating P-type ATPase [Bacteroidetes bacterium]|nr:cation-translocating P-type ATPase [Bacteroidota bacterium]
MNNIQWHSLKSDETLRKLNSHTDGLTTQEVSERIAKYGYNEIEEKAAVSPLALFISQFNSLLIIILFVAAIVSLSFGKITEAISIIIIVIFAGVLGFIQEFRAGKALQSLKKMAAPLAIVIRNGKEQEIASRELVPGDIIKISMGAKIPADARIIKCANLKVEEAALTGESVPVDKHTDPVHGENIPLGDRNNILFAGTAISFGRGTAIVIATGMETEFGKIATMLQNTEDERTPIQVNLDQLGKKLGIFAISLSVIMSVFQLIRVFSSGALTSDKIMDVFIWGVALAVAVIPEALPAVVTISLALGVRRMVKRKALIRKLPAVETLGATNIICSDKTGTLTQDAMTIKKMFTGGTVYKVTGNGYKPEGSILAGDVEVKELPLPLKHTLESGVLCNDTKLVKEDDEWEIIGDPTEGAIVVVAEKAGISNSTFNSNNPRLYEIPFSSETKKMTTVNKTSEGLWVSSKGALEMLLASCKYIYRADGIGEITQDDIDLIQKHYKEFADDALRVLTICGKKVELDIDAFKTVAEEANEKEDIRQDLIHIIENDLIFLGLVGMFDPPREEVKEAIKICDKAGIRPIMITGDHKDTAVAIARELGILKHGGALSGQELDKLTDEEFLDSVDNTDVYARISPAHKMKIVESLMKKGNIVAMTGDGVNDAPSLKKANIGVAMGITGTDVSKEAADMILTDDNFTSIVSAIEEGRSIFENIRKYLVYLLSGNLGTVFGILITFFLGYSLPINAVQILFINFIMDGLVAIALGVEPPEPGIMDRKPRNTKEGILNTPALRSIGILSIWIAIITTAAYAYSMEYGHVAGITDIKLIEKEASTVFFITLLAARFFNGFNCRSVSRSMFAIPFFSNKTLLYNILASIGIIALIFIIEPLRNAFDLSHVTTSEIIAAAVTSFSVIIFSELLKLFYKNKAEQ